MDNFIRNYFINNLKKEHFGQIENAEITAHGSICDNPDGDIVSVFMNVSKGRITEVKMECGPCDPAAIVSTNIAVGILKNKNVRDILKNDATLYQEFTKIIGGHSEEGLEHFKKIIEQVKNLLREYSENHS